MRAITYSRFGPAAEVLEEEILETPTPAAGEVLVRLHASGVNPADVKARAVDRAGFSKMPDPKIKPHSDGAGVIEAVGREVSPSRVGERVWIWNGQWRRAFGSAAEYISLPQDQAVPLPETFSFEAGATLVIPGLTACHAVLAGGDVNDRTVLVSGGAGTVGRVAVQIAKGHVGRLLAND